ncbi:MAG: S49 family peptidase [Rhodospirillales bacterium]|nr:S49 family peptidase [Rhodospirillales bacterium]
MIKNYLEKWRVPGFRNPKPVVAVLRLQGVIGTGGGPARRGLNAATLVRPIERAFAQSNLKAVALQINSPGGSPAQSSLLFKRIRAMAAEKKVPVVAFAEDVAASGGYMLACAADEIYADESSVIGSIGVISAGFGFVDLMEKAGVERRVHTAGKSKSMLDPFQKEKPQDVKRLKSLQGDIYEMFTDLVKSRRGEKLKGSDDKLFTGEFWTGKRALEFGLIDGIGELTSVMQERYGDKVVFRPIAERKSWLTERLGVRVVPQLNVNGWAGDLVAAIEERALWTRYGL